VTDRIRGLVAQVIDDRTLVINRGSDHGVQVGMRFAVLNPEGVDVVDPETGKSIGSVDVEKILVKVVRVEPKLAKARTFRTFTSGFGSIFSSGSRPEKLRTDSPTYKQELSSQYPYVERGDPVVEAVGEEFDDTED
jgi:hypothetical protein